MHTAITRFPIVAMFAALLLMAGAAQACHHGDKKDVVDTAAANENFSTLVAAVQAAGLVDTLKGDGPFTIFAPSDEAFAKLPAGTVDNLLKPENKDQLVSLLTYHVVPGKVMAADVVKLDSATSVQGSSIAIENHYGAVMVNNAKITATDITASNGVIHVIDTVIMPTDTAMEEPIQSSSYY